MSDKISKELLKDPDVFVTTSDHVFDFVEKHFATVATVVVAALIGGIGYVAYGYIGSMREMKATEALYVPEAALRKAEEKVHEEQSKAAVVEKSAKGAKAPQAAAPAHVEDFAKDYASLIDPIKTAVKEHAETRAALVSALNLSYFLLQQKQFAAALDVLSLPKYQPGSSDLLAGFWHMHRGVTLLENAQIDPAIAEYEAIVKNDALKAFQPEALLKLGVAYEMKGDVAKARDTYERIGREFPDTEAAQNAQQFMRLMQLKSPQQG